MQNSYSLLDRAAQEDVLALCERHGLGFTPFGPLAGGWLTGKYRAGEAPADGSRMATRPEPYRHLEDGAVFAGLDALTEHARERGTDTAALAFALAARRRARQLGDRRAQRPGAPEPAARSSSARPSATSWRRSFLSSTLARDAETYAATL